MTHRTFARSFHTVLVGAVAIALAACSGGGNSSPAVRAPITSGGGSAGTSAVFTIQVPRPTRTSSTNSSRRPQYVSASTQSIAIATNGGAPVVANLTPTSPGCVAATPTIPLTCTIAQPATIGADTFTLTLYDGQNAAGNVLSTATVNHTISAGHANTIDVTLNGIVSTLQLSLATPNPPIGTAATIAVSVSALDADGNIIIAPGNYVNAGGGALTIVLSDSDKSGITKLSGTKLSSPSSTEPTLSYNGSPLPSGATLTASATGVSPVTALFAPPAALNIYVANLGLYNYNSSVTEYLPNGTPTASPITFGIAAARGLAIDASGKIYVTNSENNTVTTYLNGSETTPLITAGITGPNGIAVDGSGKIYVVNSGTNSVTTYLPTGVQTTPTITTAINTPYGVAVANGKIYVTNNGNDNGGSDTVTTYLLNGTQTTPTITTGISNPHAVAVDGAGNIYVANLGNNSVTKYASTGGAPTLTITTGINFPEGIAVDVNGKIYVANYNTVTTYLPSGEQTSPTISAGLVNPAGIAVF